MTTTMTTTIMTGSTTMFFVVVTILLLGLLRKSVEAVECSNSDKNDNSNDDHHHHSMPVVPSWQTVLSDTGIVIPLMSSSTQQWILSSPLTTPAKGHGQQQNFTGIPATVPGDLISDLLKEGLFSSRSSSSSNDKLSPSCRNDDPYFDRNFITQRDTWMDLDNHNDERSEDDVSGSPHQGQGQQHYTKFKEWKRQWIYTTMFELPPSSRSSTKNEENVTTYDNDDGDDHHDHDDGETLAISWKLVIEGLKMGARVLLNGNELGIVKDQFLRYDFWIPNETLIPPSVSSIPTGTKHNLTIIFDPSIAVDGRFMACSGGWDWAPYVRAKDCQGIQMYTLGIVKPIYVVGVHQFSINAVVPKTYYLGDENLGMLPMTTGNASKHPDGDFQLDIDVHFDYVPTISSSSSSPPTTPLPSVVSIRSLSLGVHKSIEIDVNTLSSSVVTYSSIVSRRNIELWWPNGMGQQPLYNVSVEISTAQNRGEDNKRFCGCQHCKQLKIVKRIGFRTVALVTINETSVEDQDSTHNDNNEDEGSGQHGMYFRVNGVIVMARGANFIPMDQLEGRLDGISHKIVVQSAAKANMNMIRVWGGGMVPPKEFYDACDEEGILLYHDMMFVDEEGHRPVRTDTVEKEIRHLVRELATHPSIVVWNGCNECNVTMGTPSEIYATFVMQAVAQEDDTRAIWPSSPSRHGWKTGVRSRDSRPLPNGKKLTTWDPEAFPKVLESHGPYMRSFSYAFPGVNGQDVGFPYMNTPPVLKEVEIGPSYPNEFSSEFGSSVMSSYESMSATLSKDNWSIHGNGKPNNCETDILGGAHNCSGSNVLAERNYPCDSHIVAYFGYDEACFSEIGETAFQKQLYLCLISQTLWMKGEIERRRSRNSYGNLIWQLNENWPTGGWGLIEYSSNPDNGSQLLGGRWKPLMHLLELALFRDQIVACGKGDICYVRNDGMGPAKVELVFHVWQDLDAHSSSDDMNFSFFLRRGRIQWFQLPSNFVGNAQVVLIDMKVNNKSMSHSVFLRDMPKNIDGLKETEILIEISSIRQTSDGAAVVELESSNLALLVVLTASTQGRFSENCMTLLPMEKKTARFESMVPETPIDIDALKKTLRVEHMAQYMREIESSKVVTEQ